MPRRNHKGGRPQAVKKIRLDVVRRPEDQIDRRQLALALIALSRSIDRNDIDDRATGDDSDRAPVMEARDE